MALVSHEKVDALEKTAGEKLNWQNNSLKPFEVSFFVGKCIGSGGASLVSFPALIVVLLSLIIWR